jgi:hypothetical protein
MVFVKIEVVSRFLSKSGIVLIKRAGGRKYIYRPTDLIYSGQNLKSQDLKCYLRRYEDNYLGTNRSKWGDECGRVDIR